jgi:acetolactate synthase-1/2/3 large subunit
LTTKASSIQAKYSDQFIDWLVELGYSHCFFVAGGNIMHLLDSARQRLVCIPTVHEVGAGIAAEYFNQTTTSGKAFALVTAGPGLTNIVTAMAGAWLEHRELLVVGGQVKSSDLRTNGLRQRGIQEVDGIGIARPVCKEVLQITKPISREIVESVVLAGSNDRKGPVFIEFCLDVQGATAHESFATRQEISTSQAIRPLKSFSQIDDIVTLLSNALRPAILLGAGVRRETAFRHHNEFEVLNIPILTSWHGADRVPQTLRTFVGRPETWGQRAANLIVNQADVLLVLGARLGLQETGFNWQQFCPKTKIIQVEIDEYELEKGHPRVDVPICGDANYVLEEVIPKLSPFHPSWMDYCKEVVRLLPLNDPSNATRPGFVSPYYFYEWLSERATNSDVWIPASSGGANSVAIQALRVKRGQSVVCNNGLASMGYGLSGAIGAAFAGLERRVLLVEGDGGFAQNLQELATVAVNKLNVKIFIFSNEGYGSIRTTQKNYFDGAYLGCDTKTGLGFPNWELLSNAYDIEYCRADEHLQSKALDRALRSTGPNVIEVPIDPEQTYWPKISSRVGSDGRMESNPLHLMSPELSPELKEAVGKFLP